jgi:hypothetical protein
MGFSYRKRKKILPGITLSFSNRGASVRAGTKHAGVSKNTRGDTTRSAGLFGFRWLRRRHR